MAMYVYYHGNNLAVFGITPGMHEEVSEKNKGLIRPEEVDPRLVDNSIIEAVKEQRQKEAEADKVTNWEDIMKDAILQAQQETFKMHQGGQIQNTIFDTTPDAIIDDYEESGSIPLDFFSEINNLK
jgi:NADP-dependent 3-hydroxy acid dehydrogenase YdfG